MGDGRRLGVFGLHRVVHRPEAGDLAEREPAAGVSATLDHRALTRVALQREAVGPEAFATLAGVRREQRGRLGRGVLVQPRVQAVQQVAGRLVRPREDEEQVVDITVALVAEAVAVEVGRVPAVEGLGGQVGVCGGHPRQGFLNQALGIGVVAPVAAGGPLGGPVGRAGPGQPNGREHAALYVERAEALRSVVGAQRPRARVLRIEEARLEVCRQALPAAGRIAGFRAAGGETLEAAVGELDEDDEERVRVVRRRVDRGDGVAAVHRIAQAVEPQGDEIVDELRRGAPRTPRPRARPRWAPRVERGAAAAVPVPPRPMRPTRPTTTRTKAR